MQSVNWKDEEGMREHFDKIVTRFSEEAEKFYRERLVTAAVFGSVARQTATAESDVDLLVVATDLPQGRVSRVSEFEAIERRLEKEIKELKGYGIHTRLSPVIKTPEEVLRGSLLFLDMINDAVILYDRNGFFKKFLNSFQERLDKLGAKRIVQGDRWYWDLKPDYREGETFEI
jgi:predicted nucleotidyltransferase